MNLKSIIIGSLIAIATLGLLFPAVDCAAGVTVRYACIVSGRNYVAPWTEIQTHYDSDGGVRISTIQHGAEYHLFCDALDAPATFDVNTTPMLYSTITNGQEVTVAVRQSRWTRLNYLPAITN